MTKEIKIPQKQQQILVDLHRTRDELSARIELAATVILSGHNTGDDRYYLAPDCSKFVLVEAPVDEPKGDLEEKKRQFNTAR